MVKKVDLYALPILLILLLIGPAMRGQTHFGLSGGGGFTQSTGFRAALPLEIHIYGDLYFFGGPAFIQRRNRELVRKLSTARDYLSAEMDYCSLPLLLKLRLDWEPVRVYALAGIELNYAWRLQATGIEDMRLFKEKLSFEPIDISRLDGGFCLGAGLETDLRRHRKIFADLRYYLGVVDIDQSALGEIYNEGPFVTLGFMLPLERKHARE